MRKPLLLILGLGLVGCKPDPLPGEPNAPQVVGAAEIADGEAVDPPLLLIGDRPLTLSEFDRRAGLLSRSARYRLNSPAQRRRLLEMVVWAELVAEEATRLELIGGLDEQFLVEDARAHSILEEASRRSVNRADITEEEVRAVFDATQNEIQKPEERRVYTIVLPDRESALAVQEQIGALTEYDQARRIFRALAPVYSIHEPTNADGFVGELREDSEGDPAFLEAVFSSEDEGMLAEIAETSRGFEVILVDLIVAGREIPFEEYEGRIRERLHQEALAERQRALLDETRASLEASVDADALAALTEARQDRPGELTRARRFDVRWLSEQSSAILGESVSTRLVVEMEAMRTNELAAGGSFALDGSGETNDGSGDAAPSAHPNE